MQNSDHFRDHKRSVNRVSEQLSSLVKKLQSAKINEASDPIAEMDRYLRGVQLVKDDVHELAMNLAAEKAILCNAESDIVNCDFPADRSDGGDGWWQLAYSSHSALLALIKVTGVFQKVQREDDDNITIRSIIGDPNGLCFGLEGHACTKSSSLDASSRGRVVYRPVTCLLGLSPSQQIRIDLSALGMSSASSAASDAGRQRASMFFHDVLFADDNVRVDWDGRGGLDVFLRREGAVSEGVSSKQRGDNAEGSGHGPRAFGWLASAALVPAMAALLIITPAQATAQYLSGPQMGVVQVAQAEEAPAAAREEEVVLAKRGGISKEVGAVLVAPLLVYRVYALANGYQVSASLDFSILACVLSFVNRFL